MMIVVVAYAVLFGDDSIAGRLGRATGRAAAGDRGS